MGKGGGQPWPGRNQFWKKGVVNLQGLAEVSGSGMCEELGKKKVAVTLTSPPVRTVNSINLPNFWWDSLVFERFVWDMRIFYKVTCTCVFLLTQQAWVIYLGNNLLLENKVILLSIWYFSWSYQKLIETFSQCSQEQATNPVFWWW